MNVFISWSGELSQAVALGFKSWLKCVLQAAHPWMSSSDMDRGGMWANQLNAELAGSSIGIVFLTRDNVAKPWILYEAGALAKGLTTSRVCTVLIDIAPEQLSAPLAQFHGTVPDENGIRGLCSMLNDTLRAEGRGLDPATFETVFNLHWPILRAHIEESKVAHPADTMAPDPSPTDINSELLQTVRSINQRLTRMAYEKNFSRGPVVRVVPDGVKMSPSLTEQVAAMTDAQKDRLLRIFRPKSDHDLDDLDDDFAN